jgi:hypothetical protein
MATGRRRPGVRDARAPFHFEGPETAIAPLLTFRRKLAQGPALPC